MTWYIKSAVAAVSLAAWLAGCGGGVGSGGTGSPVGYSEGSVTGFGSVIVDGTAFDDSQASVQVDHGPAGVAPATVKLGQQVEMSLSGATAAEVIRIEAQVVGPVSAVTLPGTLTVLSQTIKVNSDPNAGPATLLVGYASLAEVQPGDAVEIHGPIRRDGAGVTYVQASRIEKLAALPAYLRVAGVVSELGTGASASVFKLGQLRVDAATATVVPASRMLANGQAVVVFGQNVVTDATSGQQTLTANRVRIKHAENPGVDAWVGGVVGNLTGSSFELNGVVVRHANAIVTPANTTLATGQYVQVRGSFANDGSFDASHVRIRNKRPEDPEVQLSGAVSGLDAVAQTFEVRGVTVGYSTATDFRPPACRTTLSNGQDVSVTAGIVNGGVQAEIVQCR